MTEMLNVDADDWRTEVDQSSVPVLVDFWHDACVWCRHLDPVYSQLAGEFVGKLKFAKLNLLSNERNNQLAAKFGVMGTPTMILFCNGRPIETLVGYRPKDTLKRELQLMIETHEDCFKQQTPLCDLE
jgi:thioredoxin 1